MLAARNKYPLRKALSKPRLTSAPKTKAAPKTKNSLPPAAAAASRSDQNLREEKKPSTSQPITQGPAPSTAAPAPAPLFEQCPYITDPARLPATVEACAAEARATTEETPGAMAVLFLRCLLLRTKTHGLGNKIIVKTLHSRLTCQLEEEADVANPTMLLRKHAVKQLQAISKFPNAVDALVAGATPETRYEYTRSEARFVVDRITGWPDDAATRPSDGTELRVHFAVAGVLPGHSATRHVVVELRNGKWGVKDCSDLAKPVLPPAPLPDDDGEADQQESEPGSYQIVRRTEIEHLAAGPVNLQLTARLKARGQKAKAVVAACKIERHARAEASTSGLAGRLTAVELNTKFVNDPKVRKIVNIKKGVITSRYTKPGELYDESAGFDAHIVTVEEEMAAEERDREHAELAANLKSRVRNNRRAASLGAHTVESG